jgi:hypothetical protein
MSIDEILDRIGRETWISRSHAEKVYRPWLEMLEPDLRDAFVEMVFEKGYSPRMAYIAVGVLEMDRFRERMIPAPIPSESPRVQGRTLACTRMNPRTGSRIRYWKSPKVQG